MTFIIYGNELLQTEYQVTGKDGILLWERFGISACYASWSIIRDLRLLSDALEVCDAYICFELKPTKEP